MANAGLDSVIAAYLGARADTRDRLTALLADDPHCVLGHCLDGYLRMLSSRQDAILRAREALNNAAKAVERAGQTRSEELHLAALTAWSNGDMRAAVNHWDRLLADDPCDILGIRVSQFVLSYLGES